MGLVLEVERVKRGEVARGAVLEALREAIRREEEVVDPAIEELLARRDGTIATWMATRMMHGAARGMREALGELEKGD
jgi:hypothetical protein